MSRYEEDLEERIQNLESFMSTQAALNKRFLELFVQVIDESKNSFQKEKVDFEKYNLEIQKKLENGDLIGALEFADKTELVESPISSSKGLALLEIKDWLKRQKWDTKRGEYTIADWFEIQPMLPRDIDGEELRVKDTLLIELPLLTHRQAYKLIKEKREALETYFSTK